MCASRRSSSPTAATRPRSPAEMERLGTITLWALLLLPLVISPLLGLLTPYAALLVAVPLFFVTIFQRRFAPAYANHEARAFLLVFVVLALVFAVTADSASD